MASPFLTVIVILLCVGGIAGLVLFLLRPTKEELINEEAVNDSRISSQWAGGLGGGGHGGPSG